MEREGAWSLSPADVIPSKQREVTYFAFISDLTASWDVTYEDLVQLLKLPLERNTILLKEVQH